MRWSINGFTHMQLVAVPISPPRHHSFSFHVACKYEPLHRHAPLPPIRPSIPARFHRIASISRTFHCGVLIKIVQLAICTDTRTHITIYSYTHTLIHSYLCTPRKLNAKGTSGSQMSGADAV